GVPHMIYNPNGAGLETVEGFSVFDGTGKIVRQTRYGCKPTWPGYFIDSFNYTASASGTNSIFGPYWVFIPPSGHDGSVAAANNATLTSINKSIMTLSCPNIPALTDQYAQVTWNGSNFLFNTDSGWPMVNVTVNPPSPSVRVWGYGAQLLNKQTFD